MVEVENNPGFQKEMGWAREGNKPVLWKGHEDSKRQLFSSPPMLPDLLSFSRLEGLNGLPPVPVCFQLQALCGCELTAVNMTRHRSNSDGFPQYHLRRIGCRASLPDVANLIDFSKRVTLIGRNVDVVDYVLSSAKESRSRSISRMHARVIRSAQDNQHRLVDSSFSGVYINDRRIDSDVILKEGDTVTFGHPQSSLVERGEKVRQPNSEFYFMFELCDCEQGEGSGLNQGPKPSSQLQTSIAPAHYPRFPTPRLFLGAFPGFLQGVRWPADEVEGGNRRTLALRGSAVPTLVPGTPRPTCNRLELAPSQMVWLPYCQLSPEPMGSTSQVEGLVTSSLATRASHNLVVPPVTAGETSQPSALSEGSFPIAEGFQVEQFIDSRITGCRPFAPLMNLGSFGIPVPPGSDEHSNRLLLEGRTQGLIPAEEASRCKQLPLLNERHGSSTCHLPSWGEEEERTSPGLAGGRAEAAGSATADHFPTSPQCFHRDLARRGNSSEGEVHMVTHSDSLAQMDESAPFKGGSAGAWFLSAQPTVRGCVGIGTLAGGVHEETVGSNRTSRRSDQSRSPSNGEQRVEDAAGMEWAPSVVNDTAADTGVQVMTQAAVHSEPQLDIDAIGANMDDEQIVTEPMVQDDMFIEEVSAALGESTEGITSEGPMSTVSGSCRDSAKVDVQGLQSQCQLLSEDGHLRQSKTADQMKESDSLHPVVGQWLDCSFKSENKEKIQPVENEIGSAEPPIQTDTHQDAVGDSCLVKDELIEDNSASKEDSNCSQTREILNKSVDKPRDVGLNKDIPRRNLLLQDRFNTTTVSVGNEENVDSHEGPLRFLVDEEDASPIAMAVESTTSTGGLMDDALLNKGVNCDHTQIDGAAGELRSADEREVEPVVRHQVDGVSPVPGPAFPAAPEWPNLGAESDLLNNHESQELSPQCLPIGEASLFNTGSTPERLNSSDDMLAVDKLHLLNTLGLKAETPNSSPGKISNVVTEQVGREGNLIDPEASGTIAKTAVTHDDESDVGGLSANIKPAEDGVTRTEECSGVVSNTIMADCFMPGNSLPKFDHFAHSADTKDGSQLTLKAAVNVRSIPIGAHLTTGHSTSGKANTDDSLTYPNLGKLSCSSTVGPGLSAVPRMQSEASTAGQRSEGEQSCTVLGEATGVFGGCETQGNTPGNSSEPVALMEGVEAQSKLSLFDQGELEIDDQTQGLHPSNDIKHKPDPLERTQFPSILVGPVDINGEAVGGLCVTRLTINNATVKEGYILSAGSDAMESSVILDPAVRDDAKEVEDPMDEGMDVDPVSECAGRNVIEASDLSSVSPAPSELEMLSDCSVASEAESCGDEGKAGKMPLPKSSPVTTTLGDTAREEVEGFESLTRAGDPVGALVKSEDMDTLAAHQQDVAGVPSCIQATGAPWHVSLKTVTQTNDGTLSPLTQTESLNYTAEEEPIKRSHCVCPATDEPPNRVQVSSSASHSSESKENSQGAVRVPSSESPLDATLVTSDQNVLDLPRSEMPTEQGATVKPPTMSEAGQDQPRLACIEQEGDLPPGYLTTSVRSEAAELLGEPCHLFTTIDKTKTSRNSVSEQSEKFPSVMDYGANKPGVISQMENRKSETGDELVKIQHCRLSVLETENCNSSAVPLAASGQSEVVEAEESPASPPGTIPLSCLTVGAVQRGSNDNPATLRRLERVHACENAMDVEGESGSSGEEADIYPDFTEEGSGKEDHLSSASPGNGDSSPLNRPHLDEVSAPVAHFAAVTQTEQQVTLTDSVFNPEFDSISEQSSNLTLSDPSTPEEAHPSTGSVLERELELSKGNEQEAGWSDERGRLDATDIDQLEQSVADIKEADVTEVGLNETHGDKSSQFLLDRLGKVDAAGAEEGELAKCIPSDSQRTVFQEDLVRGQSSVEEQSEEENVSEEFMSPQGTAEDGVLQCRSPLQSEDSAEDLNSMSRSELSVRLGSSLEVEQELDEGSMEGGGARWWSMESSELTDQDDAKGGEDEICSDVCRRQTELHPVCTLAPGSPEEREVCNTVATSPQSPPFTAVVSSRQGCSEVGRVSQAPLGAGEKSAPVFPAKEEALADERHKEMERSQIPEESAGSSELRVEVCPTGERAEQSPDTRQQTLQCGLAMATSKCEMPRALERERREKLLGNNSVEGFTSVTGLPERLDLSDRVGLEISEGPCENDALSDIAPCEPMGSDELIEQAEEESEQEEASSAEKLICMQVPDTLSESETSVPDHEELSFEADKINQSICPSLKDCAVPGEVDFSLNSAVGNDGDLLQTSGTVMPNARIREDERVLQETCPLAGFSEELSVSDEELLEFDQQLGENHPTNPTPDQLEQQFNFSKGKPVGFVEELTAHWRGDAEATSVTLGEKGVSAPSQTVVADGIAMTQPCSTKHTSKWRDLDMQQGPEIQKQNETMLRKRWPTNLDVEQETENVVISECGQFQQEETITHHNSFNEEHRALLSESLHLIPITGTHQQGLRTNTEPECFGAGWQYMELDVMEKCHAIVRSTDLSERETADINNTETGVEVGSTIVSSSPEYLNLQLSESESEREDIASKRLNGRRHLDSRELKRPLEEEVLSSNSTGASPNKRVCNFQQTGTEGLVPAERLSLSLLSLSKELRQHRTWYIGRMVRQFFTEYRAPLERRVCSKVRMVNRCDEVARIVREFFRTHVTQPEDEAINTSQRNLVIEKSPVVSQSHTSEISGRRQVPKETNESLCQEVQHKGVIDCGQVADSTAISNATKPSPSIPHSPNTEVNGLVGVMGDSETSSLQEGGKLAGKMETVQENSWGDTSHVISPDSRKNHSDECIQGNLVQMQEIADDDSPPSLAKGSGLYLEENGAPRESRPLPQRSSSTDSHEGLEDDGCGLWESQGVKDMPDLDGVGMEEIADDGIGDLLPELPKASGSPMSLSSAVVACHGETGKDSKCSDFAVSHVTGTCCDGRPSTDVSPPSPSLGTDSSSSDPDQLSGMKGFSVAESLPPDHDNQGRSHDVVEGFSVAEPLPPDHDNQGRSHDVVEGFSVAEPSPPDHDNQVRSHDVVEGFSVAEPSPPDHDNQGRSHDVVEGFSVAEPSPPEYDNQGHSHDVVEGFSVAEPSPPEYDNQGHSHDVVEGFSVAEPSPPEYDNQSRSHDVVEGFSVAEPLPPDHDNEGHRQDVVEAFSATESSPPDHDNPGRSHDVVGGFSATESSPPDHDNLGCSHDVGERFANIDCVSSDVPPLGCCKVQSLPLHTLERGSFTALGPASGGFAEPLPKSRGDSDWKRERECPADSSVEAVLPGHVSDVHHADSSWSQDMARRGCEAGESVGSLHPSFPPCRSPVFETEQLGKAAPLNVDARDLVRRESSSVWKEEPHNEEEITVRETGTAPEAKPNVESLEDSVTHRRGINIERLWTDFPKSGKEDTGKDGTITSLTSNQISSAYFDEDRIVEGRHAHGDGYPVQAWSQDPTEMKIPPHHGLGREGGSGACGSTLSVVSPPPQVPLTNRLSLRAKKRARESGDGIGGTTQLMFPASPGSSLPEDECPGASISCVIIISDSEEQPPLKTVKEESESDEEAGSCPRGRGARGAAAPAPGSLTSGAPSGGSIYSERAAGVGHPPGASCRHGVFRTNLSEHNPANVPTDSPSFANPSASTLAGASLGTDSLGLQKAAGRSIPECCTVLSVCEERMAGFPSLQNAGSPPVEFLHPLRQGPNPRPWAEPECVQSDPLQSQNPPALSELRNTRFPDQLLLPYSFDDEIFPPPELDYLPDSSENSDHEDSEDSFRTFRRRLADSPVSDSVFSDSRLSTNHGDGRHCAGLPLSQRDSNPSRSWDLKPRELRFPPHLTPEGHTDGDHLDSAFREFQNGKGDRGCDPSVVNAAFHCPSPGEASESSWATSDQDVTCQLRECELLLQCISQTLQAEGIAEAHVKEWKEQIEKLQQQTIPPLTHIAVIGDTGSGKSSLLNALLDEEAVLPTSAMRACTAVAVEVSHNSLNDSYCAEVEFFSEEEWNNELHLLLNDMKGKSGRMKKQRPAPNSEASVAYGRVKAVYGRILPYNELKQIRDVTSHLGKTETITETRARDFHCRVQRFIDSRADDSRGCRGGEFWPIVKRVRIRVPRSAVLRTGAVLVDLPGVRDSNAARNSIAKEYLKNCDAVWIVANVTRAVDDKTAKDMLDESLRRQLLMDGQYGRIAFICTKTDSHNVTEILSALHQTRDCNLLEDEIVELKDEIERRQTEQQTWKSELERLRVFTLIRESDNRAKQLECAIKHQESELTKLHYKMNMKRRDLSLNSIKARNFFCKRNIRLNFKCGLQELKRQAKTEELDSEEEGEESSDDDDDDDVHPLSTGGPDPDSSKDGKLHVFTVSSTEYLKLCDKLLRDGPPQVFSSIEDTEIPAVQRFVHQITLARRALSTEVVIRKVATFVSHVVAYLTNRRAQDASYQAQVRGTVQACLSHVEEFFHQTAEDCKREIGNSFSLIETQLNVGKRLAMRDSESSVLRWGLRPNGYPYPTYKATCDRNGTFTSPSFGTIDFNEELTHPMFTPLMVVWSEVFSKSVFQHLQRFKTDVLRNLQHFFRDLKQQLQQIEGDTQPVDYILRQQLPAVEAELQNFTLMLMVDITARQRSVSRILTPSVQREMTPAYAACQSQIGSGSFTRMKSCMEQYVQKHSDHIFCTASRKLMEQLDLLQGEIYSRLKQVLKDISSDLLVQFEPILKPVKIIDEIIPKLESVCARMGALCKKSRIDFTMPKIEESEAEPGSTTFQREPVKQEILSFQALGKFLGKAKMMKIGELDVSPINPVELTLDEVFLSFEVSGRQQQRVIPFRSLSSCDFCPSMHFFILYPWPRRAEVTEDLPSCDVVVRLDEQQTLPDFGEWVEAVSNHLRDSVELRKLDLHQGVERLRSLGVIFQGTDAKALAEDETPLAVPKPISELSAFLSASSFTGANQQNRKRAWNECPTEVDRFNLQQPLHWQLTSYGAEPEIQPPILKKEKRGEQDSSSSQDWVNRSMPPLFKREIMENPTSGEFGKH
ncbi:uncharacterized protein LOC121275693 isoform X2 [Carcharodon carcharias]|uniref:uncharacterized protein LOC121275693 isoform X2 n=1 Tax=Carcharodon carcharias TaxID=13397 RepID=UPI001B7E10B5|nr:uncharacterized protein LOC121275693 isoform X2 [Carcharodon carcharias]